MLLNRNWRRRVPRLNRLELLQIFRSTFSGTKFLREIASERKVFLLVDAFS